MRDFIIRFTSLLFAFVTLSASCVDEKDDVIDPVPDPVPTVSRTVLVYMVADN